MILGLNKESKNPGSALNAHSVVPIQLGPTDPQVPLANVEHKQHRCRYDDRVWPVAPTLGIGTTAPAARLSFGTSSGGLASLHLYDGGATVRSGMGINTNEFQLFAANSAHFSFNTGGDLQGVGTNELMRIQPNGNVGIGSTAPTQALDVAGAISTAAGQGFKIRYGSSSFSTGNMTGNGNTTSCAAVTGGTVNFGYTFTSAPYVMISGTNGPGACADCFVYNATSVTTTGFAPHLVNCANGTINTTFSYNWIAIGL